MKSFSIITVSFIGVLLLGCNEHVAEDHTIHPGANEIVSTEIPAISYNALFVVNGNSNSISVINTDSAKVAATISFSNASYPHHVGMNSSRSKLAVAFPGSDLSGGHGEAHGSQGSVAVVDALTGKMLVSKKLEYPNHNAIFSPDDTEIWTSQTSISGKVLILDATTLSVKKEIPVGKDPAEVTFSFDGKYAFVCNGGDNSVSVIENTTKNVVKTIPVGANPVGAWQGSNNMMYVDNEAGKSISVIDVLTLSVVRTYPLSFTPAMALISPNNELWVTDTENGKIVFFSLDSTQKTGEILVGAGAHALAFSSDGKYAYVTNQIAGTVSIISVANKNTITQIPAGDKPNGCLYRPK
jgi:YVTN family beta-propeller protein